MAQWRYDPTQPVDSRWSWFDPLTAPADELPTAQIPVVRTDDERRAELPPIEPAGEVTPDDVDRDRYRWARERPLDAADAAVELARYLDRIRGDLDDFLRSLLARLS